MPTRPVAGATACWPGCDADKDQSYFLYGLRQDQLAHTRFPLGELTKPEVREVARRHGLVTAEKPESQEICFVPGGDYRAALHEPGRLARAARRPDRCRRHDRWASIAALRRTPSGSARAWAWRSASLVT